MTAAFLTAEWRKLIMVNYMVEPVMLIPFVPAKTELDFYKNNAYISLVGFMFMNVRVKGFRIPFHINFPEVNLRFYIRYKENNTWKRGVVFIKEIVPKYAITFIANNLYGEHYATRRMMHTIEENSTNLNIGYHWKNKETWNKLEVIADLPAEPLRANSEEEFITEHFWGYSAMGALNTGEYHVVHPRWQIYKVRNYKVECDFSKEYGTAFTCLANKPPDSVFLAEGSPVAVHEKRLI